jgi:hypothetical protein
LTACCATAALPFLVPVCWETTNEINSDRLQVLLLKSIPRVAAAVSRVQFARNSLDSLKGAIPPAVRIVPWPNGTPGHNDRSELLCRSRILSNRAFYEGWLTLIGGVIT